MKKLNLLNVVALSTLATLTQAGWTHSAHALTDDALVYRSEQASVSTSSPAVSAAQGAMVILKAAYRSNPGVASLISQVERRGATLLIQTNEGQTVSIPFFTESKAEATYLQIREGASINAASCLNSDVQIAVRNLDIGCTERTFTTQFGCGLLSSTPVVKADTKDYSIVDITKSGVTKSELTCRTHPGRI